MEENLNEMNSQIGNYIIQRTCRTVPLRIFNDGEKEYYYNDHGLPNQFGKGKKRYVRKQKVKRKKKQNILKTKKILKQKNKYYKDTRKIDAKYQAQLLMNKMLGAIVEKQLEDKVEDTRKKQKELKQKLKYEPEGKEDKLKKQILENKLQLNNLLQKQNKLTSFVSDNKPITQFLKPKNKEDIGQRQPFSVTTGTRKKLSNIDEESEIYQLPKKHSQNVIDLVRKNQKNQDIDFQFQDEAATYARNLVGDLNMLKKTVFKDNEQKKKQTEDYMKKIKQLNQEQISKKLSLAQFGKEMDDVQNQYKDITNELINLRQGEGNNKQEFDKDQPQYLPNGLSIDQLSQLVQRGLQDQQGNYNLQFITNTKQHIQQTAKEFNIIIFLIDEHFFTLIHDKIRDELSYFDPLVKQNLLNKVADQIKQYAQLASPQTKIKLKINENQWQQSDPLREQYDSTFCGPYVYMFIHNYVEDGMSFKEASLFRGFDKNAEEVIENSEFGYI